MKQNPENQHFQDFFISYKEAQKDIKKQGFRMKSGDKTTLCYWAVQAEFLTSVMSFGRIFAK
ncbi:hypothetical protein [uncultured Sanguibacteroides sp.]|uniref:hypothetical protein n=1 Tax=uncultured Sanguibacteroides sp. TaxID=1635151 RepID=UPI0025E4A317|nr:hypothetical protein [uncultured Sanguibacteroides sp.]